MADVKAFRMDQLAEVLEQHSQNSQQHAQQRAFGSPAGLPLVALNHVSRVCRSPAATAAFYRDVLGFFDIKRPEALNAIVEGLWMFGYNIGLHLIKGEPVARPFKIDPKDDHLSFQSSSMAEVEDRLKSLNIQYVRQVVREGNVMLSQLFFHDPDHNMIEVCNCDCIPIVPLQQLMGASTPLNAPTTTTSTPQPVQFPHQQRSGACCGVSNMMHSNVQVPAS